MQCTSRIPLSYRRKAKTPISGALVMFKLSLMFAAIAAQLCQACMNYLNSWLIFNAKIEIKHEKLNNNNSVLISQKFPRR